MTSLQRRRGDSGTERDIPIRVLIADDDPNYRAYLSVLARRLGLQISTACDGEEALAKLNAEEFDLLLSDFDMPRCNGLQLIAAIRAEAAADTLYAVMLTGHEETQLKIDALTLGYDDFLQKQCTEVEVLAKVAAARRMLARQRALDVAMREWQAIASRDELTGVWTRRFFFEEAARHLGMGRDIGIVLLDLDDFKAMNDTHGHLTGDRILRDVGALLLSQTRHEDVIARFGGDEFVLLVTGLSVEETHAVAARMIEGIHSLQWMVNDLTISIRATAGAGCSTLLPGAPANRILDAADRELYARKWLRKHPGAEHKYEYDRDRDRDRDAEVVPLPETPRARHNVSS